MSTNSTGVDGLAKLGQMVVTLEGAPIVSYPGGKDCIYYEWAYGYKTQQGWSEYTSAGRSMNPLSVHTPLGILELRIYQ